MAGSHAPSHLSVSIVRGSSPRDSDEGLEFLRERMIFFAKVLFCLCFGFYLLANSLQLFAHTLTFLEWFTRTYNQFHLICCGVLVVFWWLLKRGGSSRQRLRWIDAAGTGLLCLGYALVGLTQHGSRSEYQVALATTNTLITRAVLIPGEAYFTTWVGVLPSIFTVLTTYLILIRPEMAIPGLPPALPTAIMALWCVAALLISAVTSRVIYGLRREVREAKSLGQYTLEEKIGEGGMGVVYKASHAMLRRPTAIKLLRADLAGEGSIARFEREVQLTSRLTHPNTIAIFDYGRTPDGTFYYAMEYLPGITLEELVRQDGPQPPGRVIHILSQVCASLQEAHGIGLIHRDIKGANVILSQRGGMHDVAKVVDFGLVRDLDNISGATLSGAQTITGTPLFLSPEAIRTPDKVDERSDLYSLGVLAYHLITGKKLFESDNFVEICGHHLHSQPIPPSVRVAWPVPKDLEGLILMCLEKEPSRRPKNASSLSKALSACDNLQAWGEEEAQAWWLRFEKRRKDASSAREPTVATSPAEKR